MNVKTNIDNLLKDLGATDPSGNPVTFSRDQILSYMTEGRCLIESLNPAFYSELTIIQMNKGSRQEVCDCVQIFDVIGQADCTTCDVSEQLPMCEVYKDEVAKEKDERWDQAWNTCVDECDAATTTTTDCSDYKVECYHLLPQAGGVIMVDPPVPDDCDGEVCLAITCSKEQATLTLESDIGNCKDLPALNQWVLYRASMALAEDASAFQAAQIYMQVFADLAAIQLRSLQEATANGDYSARNN